MLKTFNTLEYLRNITQLDVSSAPVNLNGWTVRVAMQLSVQILSTPLFDVAGCYGFPLQ